MKAGGENLFGRSRLRMTMIYSAAMAIVLFVLIFVVHETMEWSITSEQARELMNMATNVAEGQDYLNRHPGAALDDSMDFSKSNNDQLFYYVFDDDGRLVNFSRASFHIEPFILDVISDWDASEGEVSVYTQKGEGGVKGSKIMMTARRVFDANGAMVQTVYVGKDVTAMYRGLSKSTYALSFISVIVLIIAMCIGHILSGKTMQPLKEAYEKQRQFAADASHELRTPLAVVMASADLLAQDPSITSPFLKQVIDDVRDEVKKMTKLVSELLVVARSDNKALKLKPTKFDLAGVIEQTVRVMSPLAGQKKVTIAAGDLPKTEIHADEQKIRQLVLIFVDNAVKYTPEGGHVVVRLSGDKEHVRFSVQDDGIGIAPEDQKRIFDRFYRVDKARSREMGGNGLGLAIAQEIVELHKGSIHIDSEPGKGTKFTITLRRKIRAAKA